VGAFVPARRREVDRIAAVVWCFFTVAGHPVDAVGQEDRSARPARSRARSRPSSSATSRTGHRGGALADQGGVGGPTPPVAGISGNSTMSSRIADQVGRGIASSRSSKAHACRCDPWDSARLPAEPAG
jgi:hypothetical protein